MNNDTGLALFAVIVGFIWVFLFVSIEELCEIKGRKSCLFAVLSLLIPVSPLVILPLVIILPSKREHPLRINWLKLFLKPLLIALALSILLGLVLFGAIYFINR
jgi:hypothetical protein